MNEEPVEVAMMHESQLAGADAGDEPGGGPVQDFISPDKIDVAQFIPAAALAPYITQIYFFRCEEHTTRDRQPAALGHLMFFLRGSGIIKFHDGANVPVKGAMQYGPALASAEFVLDGPVHILGFALTPLGFAALTGRPANLFADRAVPAEEIFGREIAQLAETLSAGHVGGGLRIADLVEKASAFLLDRIHPVPAEHAVMIKIVVNWLSSDLDPNVDNLYGQLCMSRSTAVRLITRYFGCPPKALMRKYRALRAATILIDPNCTPELRANVESAKSGNLRGGPRARWMATTAGYCGCGCQRTITAISRPIRVDFASKGDHMPNQNELF
jgi:AraC-like DNA-binding protein